MTTIWHASPNWSNGSVSNYVRRRPRLLDLRTAVREAVGRVAVGSRRRPRISLIIPARNEELLLPRLLDTVEHAREQYRHGRAAIEVIVADNVSTDRTAAIARDRGCQVVTVEKRIIAAVRNGGAASARAEMLAFVDADARIHPQTFNAIDDALGSGRNVAGASGVHLERMSLGIAVTYAFMLSFVWITKMDTGVTFSRRDAFEASGGYRETMLFAEDVRLLVDLRRWGKARGMRLIRTTQAKAIFSMRKFDEFGDWHYVTRMVTLPFRWLLLRRSAEQFVRRYWYDARG